MFPAKVVYLEEKSSNQAWPRNGHCQEQGGEPSQHWQELHKKSRPLLCLSQNAPFLEPEAGEGGTDLRA